MQLPRQMKQDWSDGDSLPYQRVAFEPNAARPCDAIGAFESPGISVAGF